MIPPLVGPRKVFYVVAAGTKPWVAKGLMVSGAALLPCVSLSLEVSAAS